MSDKPEDNIEVSIPAERATDYARRIRTIRDLMAQGFTEQRAAELAVRIPQHPELDADGNVIVRDDDGNIMAWLKLKDFKTRE